MGEAGTPTVVVRDDMFVYGQEDGNSYDAMGEVNKQDASIFDSDDII